MPVYYLKPCPTSRVFHQFCCISQGTDIYDAKKGSFVDLGILDIQQIFGRAGRPQFDEYGHGTIITTHDKLSHYLSLLTQQNPIESQFETCLTDNLNAEVLGLLEQLLQATILMGLSRRLLFLLINIELDLLLKLESDLTFESQ